MTTSFLCKIGLHKWKKTYREKYFIGLKYLDWTGHRCSRCGKKEPLPEYEDDGNYD